MTTPSIETIIAAWSLCLNDSLSHTLILKTIVPAIWNQAAFSFVEPMPGLGQRTGYCPRPPLALAASTAAPNFAPARRRLRGFWRYPHHPPCPTGRPNTSGRYRPDSTWCSVDFQQNCVFDAQRPRHEILVARGAACSAVIRPASRLPLQQGSGLGDLLELGAAQSGSSGNRRCGPSMRRPSWNTHSTTWCPCRCTGVRLAALKIERLHCRHKFPCPRALRRELAVGRPAIAIDPVPT